MFRCALSTKRLCFGRYVPPHRTCRYLHDVVFAPSHRL